LRTSETLVVPTELGLLEVSPETGAMRWINRTKAPRWPGIVDHLVYFASEREIFEVPLLGGAELWSQRLKDDKANPPWFRPKLGVAGNRIVYSHAGQLTALDRVSKRRVWQTECSELLNIGEEIVLARLEGGALAAFELADGRMLWQVRDPNGFDSPVFSEGLVVVHAGFDAARAYDARTGVERWVLGLGPAQ